MNMRTCKNMWAGMTKNKIDLAKGFLQLVFGRDILPKNQHLHPCLYQISEDSYLYLYQNLENVHPNVQTNLGNGYPNLH